MRSSAGVPALRLDPKLLAEAETAAARMSRAGSLYIDLDAQGHRLRQARYPLRQIANMTAAGSVEPGQLLERYMSRRESRSNLLNVDYSDIGVGIATRDQASGDVWVITLAEPYTAAQPGWRAEIIKLVNRFRARHDLPDLVGNATLDRMAQGHSDDMAARDFFDHDAPDGGTLGDRARRAGYNYRNISENLAAGAQGPRKVVDGWIESPPHRRAMLDPDIAEVGVGYAYDPFDDGAVRSVHYWTLNMGLR